jgi:peptidoglycan/LPS O-acetylase OafA/YrhL
MAILLETERRSASRASAASAARGNNFRLIRHCAAAAVIFSHAFQLTAGPGGIADEPLYRLVGKTCAEIAVDVFFVTSGYLVSQSLFTRGSLAAYALARALRIYPALIAVVALTAFALGPAVTTLPLRDYFSLRPVYSYVVFDAAALSPFHLRAALPGVFESNPWPDVVNGSLWTLPWEVWMYLSLGAIFALKLFRGPWLAAFWAAALLLHLLCACGWLSLSPFAAIASRFVVYFYSGVAFSRYRDHLSITFERQAVVTILFVAATAMLRNDALLPVFLTSTIMFLALNERLVVARLSEGADLSYGIYLYAYPIQQILVSMLGPHDPYLDAAIALTLTVPLAAMSWAMIEKPALDLKYSQLARWRGRRAEAS